MQNSIFHSLFFSRLDTFLQASRIYPYTPYNAEKRGWSQGNATFSFIDHHGRQGPAKRHYVAWHLPNSYTGCHRVARRGRQRKINQQIDLVEKRARGNGFEVDGADVVPLTRVFHEDTKKAMVAYRKDGERDVYWGRHSRPRSGTDMWYVLPGKE